VLKGHCENGHGNIIDKLIDVYKEVLAAYEHKAYDEIFCPVGIMAIVFFVNKDSGLID